jgi:hypothetical protein
MVFRHDTAINEPFGSKTWFEREMLMQSRDSFGMLPSWPDQNRVAATRMAAMTMGFG